MIQSLLDYFRRPVLCDALRRWKIKARKVRKIIIKKKYLLLNLLKPDHIFLP